MFVLIKTLGKTDYLVMAVSESPDTLRALLKQDATDIIENYFDQNDKLENEFKKDLLKSLDELAENNHWDDGDINNDLLSYDIVSAPFLPSIGTTVPKMTREEFDSKWKDANPDTLTEQQLIEYKNDRFTLYETYGFSETFHSPYDEDHHNGKKFTVVRRANLSDCDLEAMPMWLVVIEGDKTPCLCYPEEICNIQGIEPKVQEGVKTFLYKGHRYQIGVIDLDGTMLQAYTLKQLAKSDYHRDFAYSEELIDKIDRGKALDFTIDHKGVIIFDSTDVKQCGIGRDRVNELRETIMTQISICQ